MEGASTTLLVGQAGKQTFRLTTRRMGDEGRGLPDRLTASPPLTVAYSGEHNSWTGPDELIELTRDVIVSIPADHRPGSRRGEVDLNWSDGLTERLPIAWKVMHRVRVLPSGLVLRASELPVHRTITIVSDGRPFLVKQVRSPLLAGEVQLPQKAGIRQELLLKLDVSKPQGAQAVDIDIQTDHPDHPVVSLTVLITR